MGVNDHECDTAATTQRGGSSASDGHADLDGGGMPGGRGRELERVETRLALGCAFARFCSILHGDDSRIGEDMKRVTNQIRRVVIARDVLAREGGRGGVLASRKRSGTVCDQLLGNILSTARGVAP